MGLVQVDEEELTATREQAASALPWKSEAERLALALRRAYPDSPLLKSEQWVEFFEQYDRRNQFSPDTSTEEAISSSIDNDDREERKDNGAWV